MENPSTCPQCGQDTVVESAQTRWGSDAKQVKRWDYEGGLLPDPEQGSNPTGHQVQRTCTNCNWVDVSFSGE